MRWFAAAALLLILAALIVWRKKSLPNHRAVGLLALAMVLSTVQGVIEGDAFFAALGAFCATALADERRTMIRRNAARLNGLVLMHVIANPGISKADLWEAVNLPPALFFSTVDRLVDTGLLTVSGELHPTYTVASS